MAWLPEKGGSFRNRSTYKPREFENTRFPLVELYENDRVTNHVISLTREIFPQTHYPKWLLITAFSNIPPAYCGPDLRLQRRHCLTRPYKQVTSTAGSFVGQLVRVAGYSAVTPKTRWKGRRDCYKSDKSLRIKLTNDWRKNLFLRQKGRWLGGFRLRVFFEHLSPQFSGSSVLVSIFQATLFCILSSF